MKVFFLIFINLFSVTLFSQDLFEKNWFLTQIHLNGTTYDRPVTYDSFSTTYFTSDQQFMFTTICVSGGIEAALSVDTTAEEINFYGLDFYPGDCTNSESIDFREAFFDFFEDLSGVTTYSITTGSNGIMTLVLENNGNQVTYKNSLNLPPVEILNGTWHLLEITVNGTTHEPPANQEVPYVELFFEENSSKFWTTVCASTTAFADFYAEDSLFFLTEMEGSAMDCNDPDNQDFQNIYSGFFWDNNQYAFSYTYENSGEEETFIIYDIAGNEAVYAKQPLSVAESDFFKFLIYPNPVQELLIVETQNLDSALLQLTDISGKTWLKQTLHSGKNILEMSSLPTGIYFLLIQSDGKLIKTHKVNKK